MSITQKPGGTSNPAFSNNSLILFPCCSRTPIPPWSARSSPTLAWPMLVRKSLSAFVSCSCFLPLPLPLPFFLLLHLQSPSSICPSSWLTVVWASRMPCATWSWLQERTKRHVNHILTRQTRGGAIAGICTHSASRGTTPATIAAPILSTAALASAISA